MRWVGWGGRGWFFLTFNQYLPPIRTLARERFKWFIWSARPAFIALEFCWVVSCKALHGSSGRPQYFGLSTLAWACCYQGSTLQIFRRIHFTLGLFCYANIDIQQLPLWVSFWYNTFCDVQEEACLACCAFLLQAHK